MQESQPLVSSTFVPPSLGDSVAPSLLIRQYKYVNGSCTFSNSRIDHANIPLQLPNDFESETLGRMDKLLSKHSFWFFPFYVFSMVLSLLFSLVGSSIPTFIGCIYVLFYDVERRRKLKQNIQSIIDQQNELHFKPMGLLLVLNPLGLFAQFDLGGSWQLNIVSNSNFIDGGLSNGKIYEIVSTTDSKLRLFNNGELPVCISQRFGLTQSEWLETIEEVNRIYLSENELEERLITRPLYWYLFACSFLFNLPILITFPIPIIYILIVKYGKVKNLKKSNQLLIDHLIQENNERIYGPKGLKVNLVIKPQFKSISTGERIIQLIQV